VSEERLKTLVADFPDLSLVPVAGDVTSQSLVDALISAADGPVDVLVNNAGIMDG
jgi:NADP-dependent 3-hydroxy acid dehydrogenase YdfG